MALRCTVPRLEAALADGPLSASCFHCDSIVFAPGWWCDDCGICVFPTLLLDADHEPEDHD